MNAKINSVRYVNRYKRIVVTVDGNMGFACELAYVAATFLNYKTAIFELADTDNIITYYLSGTSNASYVSESDIFSLNYGMKTYLGRSAREWVRRGLLKALTQTVIYILHEVAYLMNLKFTMSGM